MIFVSGRRRIPHFAQISTFVAGVGALCDLISQRANLMPQCAQAILRRNFSGSPKMQGNFFLQTNHPTWNWFTERWAVKANFNSAVVKAWVASMPGVAQNSAQQSGEQENARPISAREGSKQPTNRCEECTSQEKKHLPWSQVNQGPLRLNMVSVQLC